MEKPKYKYLSAPFNKVVDRRLKLFWTIQTLNKNYFKDQKTYSLKDVIKILNSLLKEKKVSKRTIQKDLWHFENELGILKSFFHPLGKKRGSFTYYIINKELEKIAKNIISKSYFSKLKDKKKKTEYKKYINFKKAYQEVSFNFESKNSYQQNSHHLSYFLSKDLNIKNSKERKIKFEKEEFLEKKILREFSEIKLEDINKIKKMLKDKISYRNTLFNLKDFLKELKEYDTRQSFRYFKAFLERKKNKIWFMSKYREKTDFYRLVAWVRDENKTILQEKYNKKGKEEIKFEYIDSPNKIKSAKNMIKNIKWS